MLSPLLLLHPLSPELTSHHKPLARGLFEGISPRQLLRGLQGSHPCHQIPESSGQGGGQSRAEKALC